MADVRLTRAAVQGYLVGLFGVVLALGHARALLAGGGAVDIAGLAVGLFAVGGGLYGMVRPAAFPRGTDSASTGLLVLAALSTVAFAGVLLSLYG